MKSDDIKDLAKKLNLTPAELRKRYARGAIRVCYANSHPHIGVFHVNRKYKSGWQPITDSNLSNDG